MNVEGQGQDKKRGLNNPNGQGGKKQKTSHVAAPAAPAPKFAIGSAPAKKAKGTKKQKGGKHNVTISTKPKPKANVTIPKNAKPRTGPANNTKTNLSNNNTSGSQKGGKKNTTRKRTTRKRTTRKQ